MKVDKMLKKMPETVKLYADLLWINTPKDWQVNFVYFQDILYVSILINEKIKIEREYPHKVIQKFSNDLWGLASDCVSEMVYSNKSR